jgi:hypothetical protein
MGVYCERWLIQPSEYPRAIRYCPNCAETKPYVCNERFRINAQKKTIDVWLKYGCAECGNTWKLPLLERCAIATLDAATYAAFVGHDVAMIRRYAFDVALLRRHAMAVDTDVAVSVQRSVESLNDSFKGHDWLITLQLPFACNLRLDRLLASELRVSRSTLQRWCECGAIVSLTERGLALNKPVRDGQQVLLYASRCGDLAMFWRG